MTMSSKGTNGVNGVANGANGSSTGAKELWRHSAPQDTQIYDFMKKANEKYGLSMNNYNDLWQWSVSEPANFWEHVWNYTCVKTHSQYDQVSLIKPVALIVRKASNICTGLGL